MRNGYRFIFLLVLLPFSGCMSGPFKTEEPDVEIRIDASQTHQEIWGFGATIGRSGNGIHRFEELPEETQRKLYDFLFLNEGSNIGLTIAALTVKPFHNPVPGVYIWPESDKATLTEAQKKQMADTDLQIKFAHEAQKRCPELQFKATSFTPPVWMKAPRGVGQPEPNNVPTLNGGYLKPELYVEFAQWLYIWTEKFKNDYNVSFKWLAPQNEPDMMSMWHQAWYKDNIAGFDEMMFQVANLFKEKGSAILLGGPDTSGIGPAANFIEGMSKSRALLGFIGTHCYNYRDRTTVAPIKDNLGRLEKWNIPIMQDEICDGHNTDTTYNSSSQPDGPDFIRWAEQMSIFLNGNAAAYMYWWFTAGHTDTNQMLIPFNPEDGNYELTKRCFAFGQFSRYMRPGDVRIETTVSGLTDNERFYATAVKTPEGCISLVVTNRTDSDIVAHIRGINSKFIGGRQTNRTQNMVMLEAVKAEKDIFTVIFPALSVTSLCEDNYVN